MPYSAFVIVALVIHVLTNFDVFFKKDTMPAIIPFRLFLSSIAIFYVTDILWGVFESNKLSLPLYIDTFIYFVMMGATIFFWTGFVVRYLEGNKIFSEIVKWIGVAFFVTEIVLLIVNIFTPILFSVDSNAVYKAYVARDVMLFAQIAMYSLISIYSLIYILKYKVKEFRRYIAILLFSLVMIACIAIQLGDPYIPLYSIGCLIGICILGTFSLSDSKESFKTAYQETSKMNEKNKEKLGEVLTIAYTDSLTGVKSRHAFVEEEIKIDEAIAKNNMDNFAVIVFDLNGLKHINDTLGHEAGDQYIVDSMKIISSCFETENIYRFGGDEFVVILEGEDYNHRQKFHNKFMKIIDENHANNSGPVISSGLSAYRKGEDFTFKAVFYRADKMMYGRKDYLKEHQ